MRFHGHLLEFKLFNVDDYDFDLNFDYFDFDNHHSTCDHDDDNGSPLQR
jgi:hypothetical protein